MRKIILYMFTTLDGFVAGPNGEFDDYEPSREEHEFANSLFAATDGVVFGRKTYEGFVEYWDALNLADASVPKAEIEFAKIFAAMKRVVFSRTLKTVPENTVLIQSEYAKQVNALKQQPGRDLLLICGPELIATLVEHGLIDEYRIMVKPSALGRGTALFGGIGEKLRLKLMSTHVFESGTVMHHYRNA